MTDEPSTTSAGGQPAVKPVTTVTAGTLIMGTYEIEKLINSGGMGEVYRGRNIHNDELVAIKIVLPSLAHDPKIVALFQKESTVLSRLAHEAIVRYHVFTNDPTIGRPCMVMEFVSGTALADRIEQGPMPLDDVKVMLRRVASGLEKAHRAGVVHRDLSPDNIILEDGLVEHAKLIDFGIAKSSNFGTGTLLGGQFAGKFNWVSPEQLGAYGGQVDGRSDIYSLGLVVAGVSRGQVLPMGASIVDAVSKRAAIPDLTGVDPALVPLLRWMLEPDPTHRIESMARVMAALDNPGLIPTVDDQPSALPDPNRTVIEPMPVQTMAPRSVSAAPVATTGILGGEPAPVTGWDLPAREVSQVPDGATVIAPQVPNAPPPPVDNEDISPFGAPNAGPSMGGSAAMAPMPVAKKGKGGMVTALAVLALAAGGAGAYFGGVFNPKSPEPKPAEEQTAQGAEPVKPADTTASDAEAKKAEEEAAAASAAAAKKAEEEAAAKAAADAKAAEEAAAAAKQAEEGAASAKAAAETATAKATELTNARAAAEAAKTAAEKAASDAAAADPAAVQPLAAAASAAADTAKTSAEAATQAFAQFTAALPAAKADAGLAAAMDALAAQADADLQAASAAAASATAAATAAGQTAEAATKALADAKAKEDAAKTDPIARQRQHFDALALADCLHLDLTEAKADGFVLQGFAVDTKPLEALAAEWKTATEATPDIAVHLVNEEQCAALNFAKGHRGGEALGVSLTSAGEVVKSGSPVEGLISGVKGRPLSLFLVNGKGGATNLKDFVSVSGDGTASFKFRVKLADGLPPEPQVLVAVVADEALTSMMSKVKPGTSTGGLFPFLDKQLTEAGVAPAVGISFFRLEN